MSTHNIGLYEELTKNIFQLSSHIIKYPPYLFFCIFLGYKGCAKVLNLFPYLPNDLTSY